MQTRLGHLTYCTNIHEGENWEDHFAAIRKHVPAVKRKVSNNVPFGIGLRLSHLASTELGVQHNLDTFKEWLQQFQCYVFTMNGFPYGGFHHTKVKDQVHMPDWTTQDRVLYTLQLFKILSSLLPKGMEGGVSTSPLSYKPWHDDDAVVKKQITETATWNILQVVEELIKVKQDQHQVMHLDIEPEPDGLIESGSEFVSWYQTYLLPLGADYLAKQLNYTQQQAEKAIREHVRICYDVCHFAVGYENHSTVIRYLRAAGIKVGKIQISAALKAAMSHLPAERKEVIENFKQFNESTYLHQVVALQQHGELIRYPDLPQALEHALDADTREWRSHFHVPVFLKDYNVLQSTQSDIEHILKMQNEEMITDHLEVETYTWEVLPRTMKLSVSDSIGREISWVLDYLKKIHDSNASSTTVA